MRLWQKKTSTTAQGKINEEVVPKIELVKVTFAHQGPIMDISLLSEYQISDKKKQELAVYGMTASLGGQDYEASDTGRLVSILSLREYPYYFAGYPFIRPLKRKAEDPRMQHSCLGIIFVVYPQATNFHPLLLEEPLKARLTRLSKFEELNEKKLKQLQRDLNMTIVAKMAEMGALVPRKTLFDFTTITKLPSNTKRIANALLKVITPTYAEILAYIRNRDPDFDERKLRQGLKGLKNRGLIYQQVQGKQKEIHYQPFRPLSLKKE